MHAATAVRGHLEHHPAGRITPEQDLLRRAFHARTGIWVRPAEFGTWETADGIPEPDGGVWYPHDRIFANLLRRIEARLCRRPARPG